MKPHIKYVSLDVILFSFFVVWQGTEQSDHLMVIDDSHSWKHDTFRLSPKIRRTVISAVIMISRSFCIVPFQES